MLSYGYSGAISMHATFGTNDMKFHPFTLMGFDDHRMGVPLAWIITSKQTIEDLIKWLKPLKIRCCHTCHIGNHHVFSLMMHHMN
jgi:hypothetical protein